MAVLMGLALSYINIVENWVYKVIHKTALDLRQFVTSF